MTRFQHHRRSSSRRAPAEGLHAAGTAADPQPVPAGAVQNVSAEVDRLGSLRAAITSHVTSCQSKLTDVLTKSFRQQKLGKPHGEELMLTELISAEKYEALLRGLERSKNLALEATVQDMETLRNLQEGLSKEELGKLERVLKILQDTIVWRWSGCVLGLDKSKAFQAAYEHDLTVDKKLDASSKLTQARSKILAELAGMFDTKSKPRRARIRGGEDSGSAIGQSSDRGADAGAGAAKQSSRRPRRQQPSNPASSADTPEASAIDPFELASEPGGCALEPAAFPAEPAVPSVQPASASDEDPHATCAAAADLPVAAAAWPRWHSYSAAETAEWREEKFYDNVSYTPTDDSRYYSKWQTSETPGASSAWYPDSNAQYNVNAPLSEVDCEPNEPERVGRLDYNSATAAPVHRDVMLLMLPGLLKELSSATTEDKADKVVQFLLSLQLEDQDRTDMLNALLQAVKIQIRNPGILSHILKAMAVLLGQGFLLHFLEPDPPAHQQELPFLMMRLSDDALPASILVPALAEAVELCAAEQSAACGQVVGAICSLLRMAPEATEPNIAAKCFGSLLALQLQPNMAEAVSCWLVSQPVFRRLQLRCIKFLTNLCRRTGKILGLHFHAGDRSVASLPELMPETELGRNFRLQVLQLASSYCDARVDRVSELYRLLAHLMPLKETLNLVWQRQSPLEVARAVLDEVRADQSLNTLVTEWQKSVWSECEHDPGKSALQRRWVDLVKELQKKGGLGQAVQQSWQYSPEVKQILLKETTEKCPPDCIGRLERIGLLFGVDQDVFHYFQLFKNDTFLLYFCKSLANLHDLQTFGEEGSSMHLKAGELLLSLPIPEHGMAVSALMTAMGKLLKGLPSNLVQQGISVIFQAISANDMPEEEQYHEHYLYRMHLFLEALESLSILMPGVDKQLFSNHQIIFENLIRASRVPAKVNRSARFMFKLAGGTLASD